MECVLTCLKEFVYKQNLFLNFKLWRSFSKCTHIKKVLKKL